MGSLSSSLEDYLEAVAVICRRDGVARVKDIAAALGVKDASAVGALRCLKEQGLVEQERYGFVRLTEAGDAVACSVIRSHEVICHFLEAVLGVDPKTAAEDACRIEHVASEQTVRKLRAVAEFLEGMVHRDLDWQAEFRDFCRKRADATRRGRGHDA
jgi:DtxR family transcriptional regulator, Mn-dependent transcriptional regulator